MRSPTFFPHGYCLQWDTPLIVLYVLTDALVALSYYSIPAALFFLAFKRRQSVPIQPMLILFGLFIAFCGGGHAIDIVSLWKPVYWLKGIWNAGTALTSALTAIILIPKVIDFVRMPETAERLRQETSELQEKQSLLRAVLDSTYEGIILAAPDGGTLLHNTAAQHILGEGSEPRVLWNGHRQTDEDVVRLPNGRLVERFTRQVPGYGQLYVLRDITERRASEQERLRLERIIHTMKQGFSIISTENHAIVATNPSFDAMYGAAPGGLIGTRLDALIDGEHRTDDGPDGQQMTLDGISAVVARDGYWEGEMNNRRLSGTTFVAHCRLNLHQTDEQAVFSLIQADITAQKRLEEEARRLQRKMIETARLESVGLLAGGVAHDFNNLLTGILGNASLVYDQIPPRSALRLNLEQVIRASERAADLTRQLLAYAGKGRFLVEPIEVNGLIGEIRDLVRMSIPRNVDVVLESGGPIEIEGDPAQFQQLLMNLIINGAEAIGEGKPGRVIVRTSLRQLETEALYSTFTHESLPSGTYAVIDVEDDGCGMDAATISQIFDPFFSTKFTGRGLGLAAVLGIVRGHHGSIGVESGPGRGTKFSVFLPALPSSVAAPRATRNPADLSGRGTVLVVDDEENVRDTARSALEFYGYRVLLAADGEQAIEMFRHHANDIGVVLLDLTMPVMNGEEALRKLLEIHPDVQVVLSSGYNESETMRRFSGKRLAGFLQKPYTAATLAEKIRAALADTGGPPTSTAD